MFRLLVEFSWSLHTLGFALSFPPIIDASQHLAVHLAVHVFVHLALLGQLDGHRSAKGSQLPLKSPSELTSGDTLIEGPSKIN